ncbi:TIGR02302 family protein [Microvirga rosea]|uniref:TIGR02302 family protein n=1 Tax=Microvirga rosea TaxID=2715425 RepID=UPI001D0A4298|nr:TIGR02302 family protein [Microvirga rosea]MCB8819730.1 TIGR02302 family protein [Microvirga rosea]
MSEGSNPPPAQDLLNKRFGRLVERARWALWLERAWPRLWIPLAIILVFLTLSWLGLWLETPPLWRRASLLFFGAAFVLSLWPLLRLRLPGRQPALDRLDRDTGLAHGPARALDDTIALGSDDPGSRALWSLHRRRAEDAIRRMRVALPDPDMPRRDRFALRAAAVLSVVASAFVAGPELGSRLAAAFDQHGPGAAAPGFRVDGWIDPPLYTRAPPLMIDLAKGQHLKAPIHSTVVIRVAGEGTAEITPGQGLTALPPKGNQRTDLREERYTLENSASLTVSTGFASSVSLSIEAIPDRPPEVALTGPPEVNQRGVFTLAYKAKDDYGITSAEGLIEKAKGPKERSLVPVPTITLAIPGHEENAAETKSPVDLTNHPWAGAAVKLKLRVKDEAGQEGMSETIAFTLPQRPFANPLAKALVEQRRNLVLTPDDRKRVQTALDALLIAPDAFTPQWGVFMGLRLASDRLRKARSDQDLLDVAEWLWTMALQIEDGNLSEAERDLRAAQERLKDAMERGATDDEIRRLTEELRQAMDKFLREFAERMRQNPQGQDQNQRQADRVITQNDLNQMLRQMEDAMRRGDMAEAQRLLEELRNILNNLQMARPDSRMSDPLGREMNQAMRDLEDMAREQQRLRDETFRDGQNRRMQQGERGQQGQRQGQRQRGQRGQQGQQGQQGQENAENGQGGDQDDPLGLNQRQQALRERLQELQRRMQGMGMENEQGLGDAEQAMREAENAIGQGQNGEAVDAQGRALESLRKGMQGMAQQMQQGPGSEQAGDQPGPGDPQGQGQANQRNNDPLGRPTRNRDYSDGNVRVPGVDESAAARAARILDELRRKLGDPSRPQEELDYFDRLLRRN